MSKRLRGECRECEDRDEHGEGSPGNDLWSILRVSLFYSPLESARVVEAVLLTPNTESWVVQKAFCVLGWRPA